MSNKAKRGVYARVSKSKRPAVRKYIRNGGMAPNSSKRAEERYWASMNGPVTVRKINATEINK